MARNIPIRQKFKLTDSTENTSKKRKKSGNFIPRKTIVKLLKLETKKKS